jgi:hypothetical protein
VGELGQINDRPTLPPGDPVRHNPWQWWLAARKGKETTTLAFESTVNAANL